MTLLDLGGKIRVGGTPMELSARSRFLQPGLPQLYVFLSFHCKRLSWEAAKKECRGLSAPSSPGLMYPQGALHVLRGYQPRRSGALTQNKLLGTFSCRKHTVRKIEPLG